MDVEGLLNLEDYVPPQVEKQIAKMSKEAPKCEMDPSFWQLDLDPPPLYEEQDPLAIGDSPWQGPEDSTGQVAFPEESDSAGQESDRGEGAEAGDSIGQE